MPRRKKGRPIHGWLILDKPQEMTSTAAVGKIKRLFQAQKAGHAGTLDPLATGILPIALGEATKTVSYSRWTAKSPIASPCAGAQETSTDDIEGETVATSDARPSRGGRSVAALDEFRGPDPRRCHHAIPQSRSTATGLRPGPSTARTLPWRPATVIIHELELVETIRLRYCRPFHALFAARAPTCAPLPAISGVKLGCHGHITELRRTSVGPFDEDNRLVSRTQLEAAVHERCLAMPPGGWPPEPTSIRPCCPSRRRSTACQQLKLSSADASRVARGQAVILIRGRDAPIVTGPAYATCNGRLVALVEAERGELRPMRVFQLAIDDVWAGLSHEPWGPAPRSCGQPAAMGALFPRYCSRVIVYRSGPVRA